MWPPLSAISVGKSGCHINNRKCYTLAGSSGTVQFTGLDPGIYTLRVIVRDINRDRAVERESFVIPGPAEE